MAQRKSGIKALRKSKKLHLHNLSIKAELKKTIKQFLALVNEKKSEDARTQLKLVYKRLDKAAKRNILSKNTAARRKSRFSRLLKKLQ